MAEKITQLTPEQRAKIPEYSQKWVDLASKPIDRSKIKGILKESFGEEKLFIIGESLQSTIDLVKAAIKGKKLQLRSQLGLQLDSQLNSQLSKLNSQLYSKLNFQLHSQLYSQLGPQLYSQLGPQLNSQLCPQFSQFDNKYNFYVSYYLQDWAGYYDYAKYIGVKFDEKKLKQFNDIILNIPICIFIGNVVFICEKPQCSWLEGQLHSEEKPAIGWKDGTGIYFLQGIKFEKPLWEKITSKKISAKEVFQLKNTEQRAVAIKVLGAEKLIKELGGKTIDSQKYNYGTDYLIELEGFKDGLNQPYRFLKGYDPAESGYVYIRTSPKANTIEEAHNFCYRLDKLQINYNPSLRT